MGRPTKTVEEKFQTKLKNLKLDTSIIENKGKIKVRNKIIFTYSTKSVNYTKKRYYPQKKDDIAEEGFTVKIPLSHENLTLFNGNLINPPFGAKKIIDTLRGFTRVAYDHITIGHYENKINGNQISLKTKTTRFFGGGEALSRSQMKNNPSEGVIYQGHNNSLLITAFRKLINCK